MSVLVVRLEGPLQAWSTQGRMGIRDTEREPTKSGVIGLIAAALGVQRDDDDRVSELSTVRMGVRVDRAGTLLHDYHTAGGGAFRGREYSVYGTKGTVVSHRYYLQDASFVAALEGDTTLLGRIADALYSPRYPLFLGRRSCPPSVVPLIGIVDGDMRSALLAAPLCDRPDEPPYRIVVESTGDSGDARSDVPVSFSRVERRHARRYVITDWIKRPAVPEETRS
ncbi:MAG: type I-E CRISPR-associated protein Cas5/CasD [Acidobacteria bacterium SCN 69-37]|nr:MAG: type I-E CRISPR-associated protein Cas5/CasD [Acidobacteria bacterium SCN 69-37]